MSFPFATPHHLATPPPALKGLNEIVSSLNAIQKAWDDNDLRGLKPRKQKQATNSAGSPPLTPTEVLSRNATPDPLESDRFGDDLKSDSTSSSDILETPQTEMAEEEDEDDKMVTRVVANLEAKIRAVKKRKRLAAEVDGLRKKLAAKEIELKECDAVMALEMGQVSPIGEDSNPIGEDSTVFTMLTAYQEQKN